MDDKNNEIFKNDYPPRDTSRFEELNAEGLAEILELTIKRDKVNKVIAFLAFLSAYTDNSQLNISFNAPSATGKSFIPLEISAYFPPEDIIKLGSCSPTAFFHEQGQYDKETNTIRVDLARKMLIFLDQPSTQLLERLRALLSHDEKEIVAKITDKNQGGGNRTKTVIIQGFPAVVFCSAGLKLDEQEATRFLLLSPEISQEKIREGILSKIKKEADFSSFTKELESNPQRKLLKERILAIKEEHICEIKIGNSSSIAQMFFDRVKDFKPRHQRDIGKIASLVKCFALFNLWFREREGLAVIASETDISEAFNLWDSIAESLELDLPPFVFNLYQDIIVPLFEEKNHESVEGARVGLTRNEIMQQYHHIRHTPLPDWQLRQWIIPSLETAGLITQEPDEKDKRKALVYPTTSLAISEEMNSELGCGENSDPR